MAGFANDIVFANNGDFSISGSPKGALGNGLITNGQMWIGSTSTNVGGTHINVGTLTSPLGTVSIGYSSPNITLDITGGAVAIEKVALQTGTTPIVPSSGIITFNGATVAAGTNPVRTDGTGANTMALEVQISQAIATTDATKIGLSNFNSAQFSVDANGFVSLSGSGVYISLSPYIVGSDIHSGFATIGAAITQAVADGASSTNPKNIYIKPQNGGYTENLTISDGINLLGFGTATKVIGKITMTAAGNASVTGLILQTNADYVIETTGSNTLTVNIFNCNINATNANGIHNTNANSFINLYQCIGDCAANTYFIATAGSIKAFNSILSSSTTTTTNSTFSNANIELDYTYFASPITTSGTASIGLFKSQIVCTNTIALTHGGSGSSLAMETRFESGTQSAISIGSSLSVVHCSVFSTNTNAITGAGTLFYGFIVFYGSSASSGVNTSTVTALATLV